MPSTRYQKINAHHYRHIWAVGDIHGDYQLLQSRLHQLSFCPETDLLISVFPFICVNIEIVRN